MTVIELAVAAFVLAIAVVGVVGGLTFGMTLVGGSRQRSAASAVALERLERMHNLPYDQVALYEQPTHNPNPGNPDYGVSLDDASYEVEEGTNEKLVVDTVAGALKHIDDPFTLGNTTFAVYQYVTCVDESSCASASSPPSKRVVVVVTWKQPVESGRPNNVVHSTLVSRGTVTVPGATPTPGPSGDPSPDSSPPPSPSTAPTATPGSCTGDESFTGAPGDGIQPESGAGAEQGYTSSTTVQIRLMATDGCAPISAELSNDGQTFTLVATSLQSGAAATVSWTIPGGEGPKPISGRFLDGLGHPSPVYTTQVILDQTPPATPTGLTATCELVGQNNRKVALRWNASTDAYLFGYRLYRSIDSAPFAPIKTTEATSANDTAKMDYGSVRYLVRAYDKAGTESGDSDVITFSKNNC